MSKIASLKDLEVYQKSLELCVEVLSICRLREISKDYWLVDQLKRATSSVVVNIAEGYGRFTQKDFAYFLSIALGSCNEVTAFCDLLILQGIQVEKVTEIQAQYVLLSKRIYMFRKKIVEGSKR